MMLKQLTQDERAIFNVYLMLGAGWEDIANELLVPRSEWPEIRKLYFKTLRNRKKA